jgi:putative oxidoreductase
MRDEWRLQNFCRVTFLDRGNILCCVAVYRNRSTQKIIKEITMTIEKAWRGVWNPPTDGPEATVFIRLMTGAVFFWEGVMKFVYPNLGVGRFTKLGFPAPGPLATFVAIVEIVGGLLFIAGWLTRPVALAFIFEMIVAILSTKISVFFGNSPLGMPPAMPKMGLGAVLHDIRSDYAQIMTSIFLLLAGPGRWSLDAKWAKTFPRVRASSLAAVATLLFLFAGTTHAAGSESAGANAPVETKNDFAQGQQAIKRKDYAGARRAFEQALATQTNNPDVLNMLAFSERKTGNLDGAFAHYAKALALRPRFPEAREYLAEAHLQAALQEMSTLKSYGADGREENAELKEAFKHASEEAALDVQ